jgi:hypothetical protein
MPKEAGNHVYGIFWLTKLPRFNNTYSLQGWPIFFAFGRQKPCLESTAASSAVIGASIAA